MSARVDAAVRDARLHEASLLLDQIAGQIWRCQSALRSAQIRGGGAESATPEAVFLLAQAEALVQGLTRADSA